VSGVGGIVQLDGSPVEGVLLSRLASGLQGRGLDGVRVWSEGPVGLVHAHFWTTPEELGEQQPVSAGDGHPWLAADARLDNRGELLALLRDTLRSKTPTDAELILAAYEKWGEACAKHLVGDFAFLLWDARRRFLLCARDPIGMRPLHYCREGQRLILASSVEAVLRALDSPAPVHEALLRDLLVWRFDRFVDETAYQGVRRLPPSHQLAVTVDRVSLSRYWTFGAEPQPQFRRESEYCEYFKEIFLDAVRARLRSVTPVGMLVSGGLDSSSIACAAEHLLESGAANASTRLYSCVFEESPGAEEREYAEEVARRCVRAPAAFLPSDDCWGLREFGEADGYPQTEPELSVSRALVLRPVRAAYADGCRVLLSGIGGDQVLGGEPYHTPVMLQDVDFLRIAREIPHFLRYSRLSLRALLIEAYLRPAARALRHATWGRFRSRSPARHHDLLPPPPLGSHAARSSYRSLSDGTFSARLLALDTAASFVGVEWRLPFLDRRLIDFVLALPERLRFRDGLIKFILRQPLEGILPEKVRWRTSLAHFLELEERGLRDRERPRVQALLKDSIVLGKGWLGRDHLVRQWENYLAGEAPLTDRGHQIGFLCLESWLRQRESRSTESTPRVARNANYACSL